MSQTQAMLCALAAFFGWVFMDTAIKLGSEAAISPFVIMSILGSTGVVGIVGIAIGKGDWRLLLPQRWRELVLTSLCSIVTNYAVVIALKHLPLTLFYIVVFTAPLAIAILSALLKHEKLTRMKVACLAAGFLGVIIAVGPRGNAGGEWIGCLAGLASVSAFAVYTVTIRKIAQTDTAESIQLFNMVAIGIAGMIGSVHVDALPGGLTLVMLIGGGMINMLSNFLYNKALNHTVSSNVAQLHYSQIISGALLGYLIWHEAPTWNLVAGSVLIIASGLLVAAQAREVTPLH